MIIRFQVSRITRNICLSFLKKLYSGLLWWIECFLESLGNCLEPLQATNNYFYHSMHFYFIFIGREHVTWKKKQSTKIRLLMRNFFKKNGILLCVVSVMGSPSPFFAAVFSGLPGLHLSAYSWSSWHWSPDLLSFNIAQSRALSLQMPRGVWE